MSEKWIMPEGRRSDVTDEDGEAYQKRIAQMYVEMWIEDPAITRKKALEKFKELGIYLPSLSTLGSIQRSEYFKELRAGAMNEMQLAIVGMMADKMPDVVRNQLSIASGESGAGDRDATTAGRNIFELYADTRDALEADSGPKAGVQLQFNQFYRVEATSEEASQVIRGQADFDSDAIKEGFVQGSIIVLDEEEEEDIEF